MTLHADLRASGLEHARGLEATHGRRPGLCLPYRTVVRSVNSIGFFVNMTGWV